MPKRSSLRQAFARFRDIRGFRPFCDALTVSEAASLAETIEAALVKAKKPLKPVVEPPVKYGATSANDPDRAFEAWWYSPEWAAYILKGAPGTDKNAPKAERERYRQLNDPPKMRRERVTGS